MSYQKCKTVGCKLDCSVLIWDNSGFCDWHWEKYCNEQDRKSERTYVKYLSKKKQDVVEQHIGSFDRVELVVKNNERSAILFWDITHALK